MDSMNVKSLLSNLTSKSTNDSGCCPVHPALVHIPVVLYPLAALLRTLGTQTGLIRGVQGIDSESLFATAHYINMAAILVTIPTAITGYMDYRKIPSTDTAALATVHKHIALNTVVSLIAIFNWLTLRSVPGFVPSTVHIVLGVIGVLLLGYSGHLGGELIFKHGISVQRPKVA